MALAHFTIGTETSRINLLNEAGIHIVDWQPAQGGFEDMYANSALADYDQLVNYRETTTQEQMTLHAKGASQDEVIRKIRALRQMLVKARQYWTVRWRNGEPVYVAARAACETQMRYAMVYGANVPQDSNPYAGAMLFITPTMAELPFAFVRGAWLSHAPGTGDAVPVPLSAVQDYTAVPVDLTLGNVDSTGTREPSIHAQDVYMTPKWTTGNITDIYTWSAANGFSGNLQGGGVPYALIDDVGAAPQANDYVAFGINTAVANSGPFSSLVFHIDTTGAGYTGVWQYWDTGGGGVWRALPSQDNTNQDGLETGIAFDTANTRALIWDPITGANAWGTTAVNGVTAWWVRFLITAAPGAVTAPTQSERDVYSIIWPYTEIQSSVIGGDLSALVNLQLKEEYGYHTSNRMIIGCRDQARGANFRSYINFADEQNADGVTVSALGTGAFGNAVDVPTGRVIAVTNAAAAWTTVGRIAISNLYSMEYIGEYHAFLRMRQTTAGTLQVRVQQYIGDTTYNELMATSPELTLPGVGIVPNIFNCLDVGRYNIPGGTELAVTDTFSTFWNFQVYGDGAVDAELIDFIIIPVDEWVMEANATALFDGTVALAGYQGATICIDNLTFPGKATKLYVRRPAPVGSFWEVVHTGRLIGGQRGLEPRSNLRLHYLMMDDDESSPEYQCSAQLWVTQRYLSMRGVS